MNKGTIVKYASRFFLALAVTLGISGAVYASNDLSVYQAALPALERAGGGKACVTCFLERYAPASNPKAFAVSKDGAYGARWHRNHSIERIRQEALDSCRQKPEYNPANPCFIFFENNRQVWRP